MMIDDDALPDLPVCHTVADEGNGSGCFVSEDARRGNQAIVNLFEIGSANAARPDTYQDFARTDFRHRNRLDLDSVNAAIDSGTHGFGNHGKFGFLISNLKAILAGIIARQGQQKSIAAVGG